MSETQKKSTGTDVSREKNRPSRWWMGLALFFFVLFVLSLIFNFNALLRPSGARIGERDIAVAARVIGMEYTPAELRLMREDVVENLASYRELRKYRLDNSVFPALTLEPLLPDFAEESGQASASQRQVITVPEVPDLKVPANLEELAFAPVSVLSQLLRTRQITSLALTRMYLGRLKRYDPELLCVVCLLEQTALQQAQEADAEIASGLYRGPLHGIPYGVKDLLAVKGTKTTWGTPPYKDQVLDLDATVVKRLREAGAVLVAKLSLGELAWGDVWTGGMTRNPWNLQEGSSGSSAGPASATAAGLVGFAIGSETWGSIVSPSTRCGVTGLRPSYGRVSRYGAMALSWSMDKIGPIARTAEDCLLVFNAIYGPDGQDPTLINRPFVWESDVAIGSLRIGYLKKAFAADYPGKANDEQSLAVLKKMGVNLIPIELPAFPYQSLGFILSAEAAAAFDELTREHRDDGMVRQERYAWPNVFRFSRLIPAVEYIQANRHRALLMQQLSRLLRDIDVYVAPSFSDDNMLLTNLSGHPAVVVPNGFNDKGSPTSITFTANLFDEAKLLRVAKAFQDATSYHLKHPALDKKKQ